MRHGTIASFADSVASVLDAVRDESRRIIATVRLLAETLRAQRSELRESAALGQSNAGHPYDALSKLESLGGMVDQVAAHTGAINAMRPTFVLARDSLPILSDRIAQSHPGLELLVVVAADDVCYGIVSQSRGGPSAVETASVHTGCVPDEYVVMRGNARVKDVDMSTGPQGLWLVRVR